MPSPAAPTAPPTDSPTPSRSPSRTISPEDLGAAKGLNLIDGVAFDPAAWLARRDLERELDARLAGSITAVPGPALALDLDEVTTQPRVSDEDLEMAAETEHVPASAEDDVVLVSYYGD